MASRAACQWRSLAAAAGTRRFTTATAPKAKAYAPTADEFVDPREAFKRPRGDFVPVYVALGLIALSTTLGLLTAGQQLLYAPNVLVSKKKRETVPEVEDPDWAAVEAERFVKTSVFRRIARFQDFDAVRAGISDPTRALDLNQLSRKVETLKSIGVDPRAH